MINVLFVCLGNICRSPAAEGVFRAIVARERLSDRIGIDSAGTHDYHVGRPPDARTCSAARRRGLDVSGLRARQCEAEDFRRFTYVLAMDHSNLADLRDLRPPGNDTRLALFLEFAPTVAHLEVSDPYYAGREAFDFMFELIEIGSAGLLDHLRESLK